MKLLATSESQIELCRALHQMHAALEILDELRGHSDIASHLDMAIYRFELALGTGPYAQTSVRGLISQLEKVLTSESLTAGTQASRELQPI